MWSDSLANSYAQLCSQSHINLTKKNIHVEAKLSAQAFLPEISLLVVRYKEFVSIIPWIRCKVARSLSGIRTFFAFSSATLRGLRKFSCKYFICFSDSLKYTKEKPLLNNACMYVGGRRRNYMKFAVAFLASTWPSSCINCSNFFGSRICNRRHLSANRTSVR